MDSDMHEKLREIRQRFYLMRNGVVADGMRRAGADYKVNFGLTLPQISAIAAEIEPDATLAEEMWTATGSRECILAAPMIFPREEMDQDRALRWIEAAPGIEAVDILCHRLLKHVPGILDLAEQLLSPDVERPLSRYAALRLIANLQNPDTARDFIDVVSAEATSSRPTASTARILADDLDWLLHPDDDEE